MITIDGKFKREKLTGPNRVDVLHNAPIRRTNVIRAHRWQNILKINLHMIIFLNAHRARVHVDYLVLVLFFYRSRCYPDCNRKVLFQKDK